VSPTRSDADTSLVPPGMDLSLSNQRCRATTDRQRACSNPRPSISGQVPQGPSVHLRTGGCAAHWRTQRPPYRAVDIHITCGTFARRGGYAARRQTWRLGKHREGDHSLQAERASRRSKKERHHDAHHVRSTEGGERGQRPDRHPPVSRRECAIFWIHRGAMDPSAKCRLSARCD
jgi:hypothetical protein